MKYFVIDCQLFQTGTFFRGMGRLSLGLIRTSIKEQEDLYGRLKVVGIYNNNLEPADHNWKSELESSISGMTFEGLELETVDNYHSAKALELNRQVITDYVSKIDTQAEIIYFAPALLDDTIYSCLPDTHTPDTSHVKTMAIFYDLIPFLFSERYLTSEQQREKYFSRLADVFKADLLLCDSQTTANDLVRFLFIPKEKLRIIHCGNPNTKTTTSGNKNHKSELTQLLKGKKFILSVSGDDLRKNNERMVAGFEKFNRLHNNEYKLVITSSFSQPTREKLHNISTNVIFTQKISNEDLDWLYRNARCLLFVPEYEGLGLPIIEAAEYGLPAVVANIEVFREITENGVVFVDELDPSSISMGISKVTQEKWLPKRKEQEAILELWSWATAAKEFVTAVEYLYQQQNPSLNRQKVAIVCPDPRGISQIGKFVQEQYAELQHKAEVIYFFEKSPSVKEERTAYLPYVAECHGISDFIKQQNHEYDQIIYHLGNSDYHLHTLRASQTIAGTVVLHDTDLSGMANLMRSLKVWDETRYQAENLVTEKLYAAGSSLKFSGTAILNAEKVIVHSKFAEEAVKIALRALDRQTEVIRLSHPMSSPEYNRPKTENDEILDIGFAGIINASKGLDVLELFFADKESSNGTLCHTFGFSYASNLVELLSLYKIGPVVLETDLPDLGFQNKIREMDVLLNYRPKYHGETSRATLEAMRYGVVPIVRNVGWFSELPDSAVFKVNTPQEIPVIIARLRDDRELLSGMARACRSYIEEFCRMRDYVEAMVGNEK